MKEIWRDILMFDGVFAEAYQVSNYARVRSKDRWVTFSDGRKRFYKGEIKKPQKHRNGYLSVILYWNGYRAEVSVHQLVANAFPEICGTWFPGAQIDHKDCNRLNNRPENLWFCSCTQNHLNPITRERSSNSKINRADMSKPVRQFTKDGTFIAEYPSGAEAQRQTGVAYQSISCCCKGSIRKNGTILKSAGGYIWKYAE